MSTEYYIDLDGNEYIQVKLSQLDVYYTEYKIYGVATFHWSESSYTPQVKSFEEVKQLLGCTEPRITTVTLASIKEKAAYSEVYDSSKIRFT